MSVSHLGVQWRNAILFGAELFPKPEFSFHIKGGNDRKPQFPVNE